MGYVLKYELTEQEKYWFNRVKKRTLELARDNGIGQWSDNIECIWIANEAISEMVDKMTAQEAFQVIVDLDLTDWRMMRNRRCTEYTSIWEVAYA